jgi:hypothetical protein
MKALARILLLLCLLPGLVTGVLPLPGQAAGLEMVICADDAPQVIRLGPDGTPMSSEDCETCCLAAGPTMAPSPDPVGLSSPVFLAVVQISAAVPADLPARRAFLIPAPRGPPNAV